MVGPTYTGGLPVATASKAGAWRRWWGGHRSAYCVRASDVAGPGTLRAATGKERLAGLAPNVPPVATATKVGAWRWWWVGRRSAYCVCASDVRWLGAAPASPERQRRGWPELHRWSACGDGGRRLARGVGGGLGIAALTACAPRMRRGLGALRAATGKERLAGLIPVVHLWRRLEGWRVAAVVGGASQRLLRARLGCGWPGTARASPERQRRGWPDLRRGLPEARSSEAGAWRWWLAESAALTACAPRMWGCRGWLRLRRGWRWCGRCGWRG